MQINYNVSGSDRKQLVAAIAQHTGEKPKYLGAPGFAYQVSSFTVSADGKVTIEDNSTAADLIRFLREKGFQAEDPLTDCIEDDATEEQNEAEEITGVCISMPRSLFSDSTLENLKDLVAAKGSLIKKALGTDELPIEVTDTKVSFPWFVGGTHPGRTESLRHLHLQAVRNGTESEACQRQEKRGRQRKVRIPLLPSPARIHRRRVQD